VSHGLPHWAVDWRWVGVRSSGIRRGVAVKKKTQGTFFWVIGDALPRRWGQHWRLFGSASQHGVRPRSTYLAASHCVHSLRNVTWAEGGPVHTGSAVQCGSARHVCNMPPVGPSSTKVVQSSTPAPVVQVPPAVWQRAHAGSGVQKCQCPLTTQW
jgi:hypothetical protein